jgi:hypothetical protein
MNANKRPCPKRRRTTLLLALATTLLLAVGVASAGATSSIEGVWSFNGGAIAVQPAGGGTFKGTVVTETRFAECAHPVGQLIWTSMTPQPDGSYWGFHQWYFEKASCALNPTLGAAAWRVIEGSGGTRYLRVCLSNPGTAQPTIAANGTSADTSYGCVSSAPAQAGTASFSLVSLPSTKKCLSLRRFQIHIRDPRNDAFKSISITLKGHKIRATRHGKYFIATVSLKGLPRGTFTIKISGTTVLGNRLAGSRTYHTCIKKRSQSSKKTAKKH